MRRINPCVECRLGCSVSVEIPFGQYRCVWCSMGFTNLRWANEYAIWQLAIKERRRKHEASAIAERYMLDKIPEPG